MAFDSVSGYNPQPRWGGQGNVPTPPPRDFVREYTLGAYSDPFKSYRSCNERVAEEGLISTCGYRGQSLAIRSWVGHGGERIIDSFRGTDRAQLGFESAIQRQVGSSGIKQSQDILAASNRYGWAGMMGIRMDRMAIPAMEGLSFSDKVSKFFSAMWTTVKSNFNLSTNRTNAMNAIGEAGGFKLGSALGNNMLNNQCRDAVSFLSTGKGFFKACVGLLNPIIALVRGVSVGMETYNGSRATGRDSGSSFLSALFAGGKEIIKHLLAYEVGSIFFVAACAAVPIPFVAPVVGLLAAGVGGTLTELAYERVFGASVPEAYRGNKQTLAQNPPPKGIFGMA